MTCVSTCTNVLPVTFHWRNVAWPVYIYKKKKKYKNTQGRMGWYLSDPLPHSFSFISIFYFKVRFFIESVPFTCWFVPRLLSEMMLCVILSLILTIPLLNGISFKMWYIYLFDTVYICWSFWGLTFKIR